MTITKQKECNQCDATQRLEPLSIGSEPYDWIEIIAPSWKARTIFRNTMHFCSDKCLIEYIKSKTK